VNCMKGYEGKIRHDMSIIIPLCTAWHLVSNLSSSAGGIRTWRQLSLWPKSFTVSGSTTQMIAPGYGGADLGPESGENGAVGIVDQLS